MINFFVRALEMVNKLSSLPQIETIFKMSLETDVSHKIALPKNRCV